MPKTKTLIIASGSALLFSTLGFGFGALFYNDLCSEGQPQSTLSSPRSKAACEAQNQALKQRISELELELSQQREKLQIALQRLKTESSKSPAIAAVPTIDDSQNELTQAKARIAELEAQLAERQQQRAFQSTSETLEAIETHKASFWNAVQEQDGPAAIAAMREMAALGKTAYEFLPELWAKMIEVNWFGVRWRNRRVWFNKDFFHWVLDSETKFSQGQDLSQQFRRTALQNLDSYEMDLEKLSTTYIAVIRSQQSPKIIPATLKPKEQQNLRRQDLYRIAFNKLTGIPSVEASSLLSEVYSNQALPLDIRRQAVRGLVKQKDSGSLNTLRQASRDSDEDIRKRAALGLARRDPPVDGWLITTVTRGSQANLHGIEPGAIITAFNNKPVLTTADLRKHRDSFEGSATMTVFMNGQSRVFPMQGKKTIGVNGESVKRKR